MKIISLDQVFYRYSKPAKDDFGFIPDKARSKAIKLRNKLENLKFDLTPYHLGYLRFGELFELRCSNRISEVYTKPADPLSYCYVRVALKPEDGCTHPLVEMCRRILSVGDKELKGMAGWFPSWQMACIDIYESMVDSINRYLKHLIELYDRIFEIKGVPDNIGVNTRFCKETNKFEFALEVKPKDVKGVLDFYRADGWCEDALKPYREYLIESLAKASVAAKTEEVTPFEPMAIVMPMFVYTEVASKRKEEEKMFADCKDTIEQITAKVSAFRGSTMETTNT